MVKKYYIYKKYKFKKKYIKVFKLNLKFNDGSSFNGKIKLNKKNGYGKFTYIDGDVYEGEIIIKPLMDGKDNYNILRNGKGKYTCKGNYFYLNDSFFEGKWENDDFIEGEQIFNYYNSTFVKRKCFYKNGIKDSKQIYHYKNGEIYEGKIKAGKRNGYGICNYLNGDKYYGYWKNNKRHGRGIHKYNDGEKYEGNYKEGKRDGIGIYYYLNGDKYKGNWNKNKKHGYGIYYYKNGNKYEGEWKENNKHYKFDKSLIEKTVDQVFSNIGKKRKIDEIKVKSEIKKSRN
tara:strand:+ start:80 stop:940 length:861 start_codon:yes stop_codon:yes gene_type:complete